MLGTDAFVFVAQIRFLGGKLGDAMATQFGATTVSELREIELGMPSSSF